MSRIDWLIVNETEAAIVSKHSVTSLEDAKLVAQELLPKVKVGVIITLGDQGAVGLTRNESVFEPAISGVKVVDTTGAGDSFIGGVVSQLVEGHTLSDSMKFATKVSAYTIGGAGGQQSFPTKSKLNQQNFSR